MKRADGIDMIDWGIAVNEALVNATGIPLLDWPPKARQDLSSWFAQSMAPTTAAARIILLADG